MKDVSALSQIVILFALWFALVRILWRLAPTPAHRALMVVAYIVTTIAAVVAALG